MKTDAEKYRHYLLGKLAESEAEELDLQIIRNPDLEDKLFLAEDLLIEDYLDDALSAEETGLFHKNFLISEERREHLEQMSVLKNYARNLNRKPIDSGAADGFFQSLKSVLTQNFKLFAAASAGLLFFGFLAIAVWQFGLSDNTGETALLEKQAIELNRQDLSDLGKFENLSKLSLISGLLRSSGDGAKLNASAISETVLLRMALPPEQNAEKFSAKIVRNQIESFSIGNLPAYKNQSGREVRLLLPAAVFKTGEYKIELHPEGKKDFSVSYSFTVQ